VTVAFYIISFFAITSALLAVSLRNLVYCGLSAALFFLSTAAMFILLKAEFIAVVQIIIYIGAVATLILFVIMLTHRLIEKVPYAGRNWHASLGVVCAAVIGLVLAGSFASQTNLPELVTHPEGPTVQELGKVMLTEYLLPFEVTSLLLTVAMIGGIVIALGKGKDK